MKKLVLIAMTSALLTGCMAHNSENTDNDDNGMSTIDTLVYQCGSVPLVVTTDKSNDSVKIMLDGQLRSLPQVVAASGAKYDDGSYSFWSKGSEAMVYRGESVLFSDCQLQK